MTERKYSVYGFFEFTVETSKNPQKIKDAINKILEMEGIQSKDFEISIDLVKEKESPDESEIIGSEKKANEKATDSREKEEKEKEPKKKKGRGKAKSKVKGRRQGKNKPRNS